MQKIKWIKSMNDFIIGLVLFALGLYVVTTKNMVQGTISTGSGGIWVRPDTYARLIGGLLAFFSLVLIIKAVNFSRSTETKGLQFVISREIIFTVLALIGYVFLLPKIGFGISTFILTLFLTCMFIYKEKTGADKPPLTKQEICKSIIIALIYSIILVIAVYLLFSKVLHVALP